MLILSCRNIKKEYAELEVLKDINLDIAEGEIIGLVGKNGAGKTTLANILTGAERASSGQLIKHKDNLRIEYLLQSTFYTEDKFKQIFKEKEQGIGEFFATSSRLGLVDSKSWQGERLNNLSGGEKTKLALADIWIEKADLLILDEPTNHLDIQGVEWLIAELKELKTACIIISHDRYFLDRLVDRILELEEGSITEYQGNYTFYREEKERQYKEKLHQYNLKKKKERQIEGQVQQLSNWSNKGHNQARKKGIETGNKFGGKEFYRAKAKKKDKLVKSKLKKLEKLKENSVEKPRAEPDISFEFSSNQKRGRRLIEAKDISKKYHENVLFQSSSFYITHGERIAIFGKNGCGKSTLLKIIMGQERLDSGELWLSPSLSISYLSQDVMDLNPERSILESVEANKYYNSDERHLLTNLGFDNSILDKKVKKLSLGERTKIKLAKLILQERECLILDEPNNHLDLYSREQLEDTLLEYPGTIILVSHDRYLLEKISKKILIIENKEIKRVEKGFAKYWQEKESDADHEESRKIEEELMLLDHKLASIISRISLYTADDEQYLELDAEYQELISRRNILKERL